jgi:hypothetical protein
MVLKRHESLCLPGRAIVSAAGQTAESAVDHLRSSPPERFGPSHADPAARPQSPAERRDRRLPKSMFGTHSPAANSAAMNSRTSARSAEHAGGNLTGSKA